MCDRTPEGSHQRAQPLSLALDAQHQINFDDLLDNGVPDVADLIAALDPKPQAEARNSLTWVGPISFNRLTATRAGFDADTVETAIVAALALDPHLPVDRLPHVLPDVRAGQSADFSAAHAGPVRR